MKAFRQVSLLFAVFLYCISWRVTAVDIMDSSALADFPNPPADEVIFYGKDQLQYGELRLPSGEGPHPVLVFIHGGCWLSQFDISHSRKLVAAFTEAGIATWNLEYRRVGNPGGGWSGTFDDIANGVDHLRTLADKFELDLNRVVVAGHSAGGHLALWFGNRPEQWQSDLKPRAVFGLAPAADLEYLHGLGVCDNVVDRLMGGSPSDFPERYKMGSGSNRLPMDIPQYILLGEHDLDWTPVGQRYVETARRLGNTPNVVNASESGHFEMIDPDSSTWPLVLQTARTALGLVD